MHPVSLKKVSPLMTSQYHIRRLEEGERALILDSLFERVGAYNTYNTWNTKTCCFMLSCERKCKFKTLISFKQIK